MKKRIVLAILLVSVSGVYAREKSSLMGTQDMEIGTGESKMVEPGEVPTGRAIGLQKASSGEDQSLSRLLTPTTKERQDKTSMLGTLSERLTETKPLDRYDENTRDATGYMTTGGVLGTQSYTTGASMSPQSYTAGESAGTEGYFSKSTIEDEDVP